MKVILSRKGFDSKFGGCPSLGGPDDETGFVDLGVGQPSDARIDAAIDREGWHGYASAVSGAVPIGSCGQMGIAKLLLAKHAPEQIFSMFKHIVNL
jgi:hypothetical protein